MKEVFRRSKWRGSLAIGLIFTGLLCGAARSQTLKENSKLFDKPNGAQTGASLSAGAAVKVVERQGFWVRLESGDKSGWLKASAITFSAGAGGPTAIDTGRMGAGNIVSTSAARGLSAKDLVQGTPKPEEVTKMRAYQPDAAALQLFQSQGNLSPPAQNVALRLAEPPPKSTGSSDNRVTTPANTRPAHTEGSKSNGDDW